MGAITKLIILTIATEAAVELWKRAAPLQEVKEWVISKTPFLYSQRLSTHLLECHYCLSVWAGTLAMIGYLYMDSPAVVFIVGILVVQRAANFLHLGFSYLRDKQMDLRVARNTRR